MKHCFKTALLIIGLQLAFAPSSSAQKKIYIDELLKLNSEPMKAKRKGSESVGKYEFGSYKVVSGKLGWTGLLILLACIPGMIADIRLDDMLESLVSVPDIATARFVEYGINQLSDGIVDAFSIPMYAGLVFLVAALLDTLIKKIDFKKKADKEA